MTIEKNKAIFFDRDGTVIADKNYLSKPEEIEYLPQFFEAYKKISDLGFLTFLITNQSGIGRGFFTVEEMNLVHHQMQRDLINLGLKPFKEIKHCPHKPEDLCLCRKPNPLLALDLIQKYNIDPAQSYMLGDKDIDLEMAEKAGLNGILIESHQSPTKRTTPSYPNIFDFVVSKL